MKRCELQFTQIQEGMMGKSFDLLFSEIRMMFKQQKKGPA
jgi:hypothetical protein